MQYSSSVILLAVTAVMAVASAIALIVRRRAAPTAPGPYETWDAFVRDVLDPEVPIDRILARCGGRLPRKPPSRCVMCGTEAGDVFHAAAGRSTRHCDRCADACETCVRVKAPQGPALAQPHVGSAPCAFCRRLCGGGR